MPPVFTNPLAGPRGEGSTYELVRQAALRGDTVQGGILNQLVYGTEQKDMARRLRFFMEYTYRMVAENNRGTPTPAPSIASQSIRTPSVSSTVTALRESFLEREKALDDREVKLEEKKEAQKAQFLRLQAIFANKEQELKARVLGLNAREARIKRTEDLDARENELENRESILHKLQAHFALYEGDAVPAAMLSATPLGAGHAEALYDETQPKSLFSRMKEYKAREKKLDQDELQLTKRISDFERDLAVLTADKNDLDFAFHKRANTVKEELLIAQVDNIDLKSQVENLQQIIRDFQLANYERSQTAEGKAEEALKRTQYKPLVDPEQTTARKYVKTVRNVARMGVKALDAATKREHTTKIPRPASSGGKPGNPGTVESDIAETAAKVARKPVNRVSEDPATHGMSEVRSASSGPVIDNSEPDGSDDVDDKASSDDQSADAAAEGAANRRDGFKKQVRFKRDPDGSV